MNFPLFIAKRIYSDNTNKRKVSRPAIRIATIGVAVGLAVMIISVSVVVGFKHSIRDKVVGFGSHIQVAEFTTLQGSGTQPIAITDSVMRILSKAPNVKHVQKFAIKQGILKTDTDFLGVMFKGISAEYDTTFIHQNMIDGSIPAFSNSKSSNRLLISKIMADKLQTKCGDRLFAYFIDDNGVRVRRFTIAGIYQTNLTQYDKAICFTDLYTACRLNGWDSCQVSGAEIAVNDYSKISLTEDFLIRHLNRTLDCYGNTFTSKTIREINPQIFSWLDLLDLNVWIILAIMTVVAVVTMISGLLIIILERTTMIGILKALGASNRTIRHTFLWFATFIVAKGLIIGDLVGIGLVILQKYTGLVKLDPATYYISTVPVELNIVYVLLQNLMTLLVSVVVLVGPSYLISHIHPAKSMRYE